MRPRPTRLLLWLAFAVAALVARAQPGALSVNTASREEVRQFYRAVYLASENVAPGWTGDYAAGRAGDISPAFREATRLRINFFRALAGVPADITFKPDYNAKAQAAALLQSVNAGAATGTEVALSHQPPASWTFFSAAAAEASAHSNLSYGTIGPAAIDSYVADGGLGNHAVGHRRWLFQPQTLQMGSGDVPGDATRAAANATWILDRTAGGRVDDPRPATRSGYIAYPPAGFVPYSLVWPRWSFSHPDADFSAATVTMTRNGQPIAVLREPELAVAVGEPTLVWVYDNRDPLEPTAHPRPSADVAYDVTLSNVRIGAEVRTFAYRVVVFDPDLADSTATAATVALEGPRSVALNTSAYFTVNKPAFAAAAEWRMLQSSAAPVLYTAEDGLAGLRAVASPGYDVAQSSLAAAGSAAFHLAHPADRAAQILRLPETLLPGRESTLTFFSRLGVATAAQTARVQLSLDGGASWFDVFRQSGTSLANTAMPVPTEAGFVARSIPLRAWAGRTVEARFVFSMAPDAAGYQPDAAHAIGWFLDNIAVTDARIVTALGAPTRIESGTTFGFSPAAAGAVGLQARSLLAGAYGSEWGRVLDIEAVAAAPAPGTLANFSVRTRAGRGDDTLVVGLRVEGGSAPLLLRGVGPGLIPLGIPAPLPDPRLELLGTHGRVASNDDWDPAARAAFAPAGAFDLPTGSRDAVILRDLPPDNYTLQLSAAQDSGLALAEVYHTAAGSVPGRLTYGSARARVGNGDDLLVAGFTVVGPGSRTVLLRAVGPTLTAFGVPGALADPRLELFQLTRKIGENDNWPASAAASFTRVGAFQLTPNSRDSALVVTLAPGSYTAQITGAAGTSGLALVEVYELP